MDRYSLRLQKLLQLIDAKFEGKPSRLAAAVGKQPSYIYRMLKVDNNHKRFGDDLATQFESALGLPSGWFDQFDPPPDLSIDTHVDVSHRQEKLGDTNSIKMSSGVLLAFSARINELCDDLQIPIHGRQTEVGRIFGVSQKGARKWLEAEGFPSTEKCVEIAVWGNVSFDWLMTGRGAKNLNPAGIPTEQSDYQPVINFSQLTQRLSALHSSHQLTTPMLLAINTLIDAFEEANTHVKILTHSEKG